MTGKYRAEPAACAVPAEGVGLVSVRRWGSTTTSVGPGADGATPETADVVDSACAAEVAAL
ncbi:Uncharacterised protein [Mycobacteroides abscessus subsp. abscessus]|nr:Uncharacterised protein [Mycobacteroides abscessus subsp. abscessus]SKU59129.1 Uncharacterised protein [Mycobacteroides abscessus subsp. abscessus]